MSPTVSFYEYNKDRADNVRKRERERGREGMMEDIKGEVHKNEEMKMHN